jgi:uncharacterized protein (DUF433 family)
MLRFEATPCPLLLGSDGTIRVTGSGVPLELVVGAFDAGATPEQIAEYCPSLSLSTLYGVISYVLNQRAEVDLYLRRRADAGRRPALARPACL